MLTLFFTSELAQEEVAYSETYSPVVKPITIRTVLPLALSINWAIMPYINAFLNGEVQRVCIHGATSRVCSSIHSTQQAQQGGLLWS